MPANRPELPVISSARLRTFEPKVEWFARASSGLHGIGHETRVLIWTQVLAVMEVGALDADVLGWAAVLHDARRENDGIDESHGALAADWLLSNPWLLPSGVPIERVEYLCRWHAPSDQRVPAMTKELAVFKDADALDRWRFGEPNPDYFRTSSAQKALFASRDLALRSRSVPPELSAFEHVIVVAQSLGIVE